MERFIRPMAPGWFASVMGTAVTSLALTLASHAAADACPALAASEGVLRELAFALNMTGFGAGVFMYVGLLALTMARHFLGAPVEGKMTPTLWVHLAPLSVIPLSMLALLKTTGDASLLRYGSLVAAAFLGAALWWLVLAVSMTIRNRRQGKLPFALSWWAFVFPIGACSVLAYRVSELLALEVLPLVASGLTLLALFVWSAAALGTVRGIRTGAIFAPAL